MQKKKRGIVMKSRQPGIDLLRIVGMLFVVGVHSFLKNGFYSEPQVGLVMWGADSFRWLFYGCNGIFMMLTGYLKCNKPLNKDYYCSLLPILVGYVLTCAVSFPIRHFFLNEQLDLAGWVGKMVTFGNYAWYVEMYIGLFLFAPVINLALQALKEPKQLLWLAGTMAILTALPSITAVDLIPDYWTSLYPVTYYVIGAVIRRLQPKCKSLVCLACAAGLAMLLGAITLLTTDETVGKGFGQGYGGFWITAIVTCLFLGLYRLQMGPKRSAFLSWCAGGVFEGYMLSRLFDVWLYDCFKQWHTPEKYPLLFFCVTISIFIMSLLLGKAVHTAAVKLIGLFPKKEMSTL